MTEALPDKLIPGDPVKAPHREMRHAHREGYIDGWNDAIDACERALEAKGAPDLSEVPFLIHFDDADCKPRIVIGEAAARHVFKEVSSSWNAHLFVKIASNARDDRYASKNATLAGAPQAPQVVPEPGTEPPAMHLASVIETVADLLERSGNAKLGASLLRDGLKERKRRDQVAPEPPAPMREAIAADLAASKEGVPLPVARRLVDRVYAALSGQAAIGAPPWCEIHQHYKWCEHNGGVMGETGYEPPADQVGAVAQGPEAAIQDRADAERYRWLRDACTINQWEDWCDLSPTELDAATDAALGKRASITETQRSSSGARSDEPKQGVGGTPAEPLQSLLEELRIQCSWLTGADYSNAMTLLDRIETALHQPVEPLREALAECVEALRCLRENNAIGGGTADDVQRIELRGRAALHQSETPTSSLTSERASADKPEAVDGDRE